MTCSGTRPRYRRLLRSILLLGITLGFSTAAQAGGKRTLYESGDVRVEVEPLTSKGVIIHLRSELPEQVRDRHGVLVANPVAIGIGKGTMAVATRPPLEMDPAGIRLRKDDPVDGIVDAIEPSKLERLANEVTKDVVTSLPKVGIVFGVADKVGQLIQAVSPQANPADPAFSDPSWTTTALVWDPVTVRVTRAGIAPDHLLLDVVFPATPGEDAVIYVYFQTWTRDAYNNTLTNMQTHEVTFRP